MCRHAFVRLGRLCVPAKYRKQRCKRQDDYDFAANAVDLLPTHGVTSFPACCHRFLDAPDVILTTTKSAYGVMIRLPTSSGEAIRDLFSGNRAKRKSIKPRDYGLPEVRPCANRTRKTKALSTSESRKRE